MYARLKEHPCPRAASTTGETGYAAVKVMSVWTLLAKGTEKPLLGTLKRGCHSRKGIAISCTVAKKRLNENSAKIDVLYV